MSFSPTTTNNGKSCYEPQQRSEKESKAGRIGFSSIKLQTDERSSRASSNNRQKCETVKEGRTSL
jgi:hypothetical protein